MKAVPIPLSTGKIGWVHAGPTRSLPDDYDLIRCAEEIPVPAERIAYDVSTGDFKPFDARTVVDALPDILADLGDGRPLYVGCMGGTGRTGTMLAILVAQHPAFTGQTAIAYVRANYKAGAVETKEQEQQVLALAGAIVERAPTAPIYDDFGWDLSDPVNASAPTGGILSAIGGGFARFHEWLASWNWGRRGG